MLVGVRRFDSNRLGAILTLKGAFGVQNALRFVNFRPLPPEGGLTHTKESPEYPGRFNHRFGRSRLAIRTRPFL